MSVVWHTADPHLGHRHVAGLRGFEDTAVHDQRFIDHWRDVVAADDIVYIEGDLAVSSPTYALEALATLPGRKRLITGNHDRCHPMYRDAPRWDAIYRRVFEWIAPFGRRKIAGQSVLLSHYPYHLDRGDKVRDVQYRLQDYNGWLLHGHLHSDQVWTSATEIHVGWDAWHRLVPEREIADLITSREEWKTSD